MSAAARRLASVPLALLLGIGAAILPPAAAPVAPFLAALEAPAVRAADGLTITSAATYVVVPASSVVRATVDVTLRNDTPTVINGGAVTRYFYDAVNLGLQPDAVRIRATQDGSALAVRSSARQGFRLVTVTLAAKLYYQETTSFRLTFDLPGGTPRSASDVRVGRAFATFLAWAFGDSGTVRIVVPRPYTASVTGDAMDASTTADQTILTAETADALSWYAWVDARNDAALTREQLDIPGGEEIIVRGWPEDTAWRGEVGDVLTRGVPALVGLIGLPWPVNGPLSVVEVHTPQLEGYAGFYDPSKSEITVSEELDDVTIVHEASHAWFNERLFTERWITEGLANEYAARVLGSLGQAVPGPDAVKRSDPVSFPLNGWPPPAAIRDQTAGAREQYGYDASWTVIRAVVRSAGEAGMRAVFKAAADGTTAYVGAGAPEASALPNDWRRFLDLTEELGGATGVADLVATWALTPGESSDLTARASARTAYHALLTAGRGWKAPYAVRAPMDSWSFTDAQVRIADASRILEDRDRTAGLASTEQLVPPRSLETAYEGATTAADLAAAEQLAQQTRSSLEAIAAADKAAASPRDWLVSIGLLGADPDADLAGARDAWSAGDVASAASRATLASATLVAAPGLGRERVVVGGVGLLGTILLLVLVAVLLRRRARLAAERRRLAAAGAGADWPAGPGPSEPAGGSWIRPGEEPDRYATLPASEAPGTEPGPAPTEPGGSEPP